MAEIGRKAGTLLPDPDNAGVGMVLLRIYSRETSLASL